jgi:hypothetical protein
MLTLGFDRLSGLGRQLVAFAAAGVGLTLLALVITYLPSLYGAFARREALVTKLGGLIRHVIETGSYFKEYVVNYTNACAIVDESFRDTEDPLDDDGGAQSGEAGRREQDDSRAGRSSEAGGRAAGKREGEPSGVFSGYDPETGAYNPISWMYGGCRVNFSAGPHEHATQAFSEHTGAGMLVDGLEHEETLEHPRCVFQILRRHFARYTPDMGGRPRHRKPRHPTGTRRARRTGLVDRGRAGGAGRARAP